MRSGGVPWLKRGCRVDWIFWVAENFTFAPGKAFSYTLTASSAYSFPKPPSNRTNSICAVSLTPSGFFAVFLPVSAFS
ncbi:hypothetical protein SHIRM173S_03353 [Streptomyces hirsutus]